MIVAPSILLVALLYQTCLHTHCFVDVVAMPHGVVLPLAELLNGLDVCLFFDSLCTHTFL